MYTWVERGTVKNYVSHTKHNTMFPARTGTQPTQSVDCASLTERVAILININMHCTTQNKSSVTLVVLID